MGAFEAIIVLTLVGFLMLAAEVCVPGMVLGALGGLCLLIVVGISYSAYGPFVGTLILTGVALVTVTGFVAWMYAFPHTPIGRHIMLQKSLVAGEGTPVVRLLGHEGRALTPLRPAGTAFLDGRKIDVVTEGDFIVQGDPVVVIHEEGMRVVVRKKV